MARSGSNSRQRRKMLSARFNDLEAAALRAMADAAGISVSSLIRRRVLGAPPPRASRRPTVSHELASRLLVELGRLQETLRAGLARGDLSPSNPTVIAALRDLAELRAVCFAAMGRSP